MNSQWPVQHLPTAPAEYDQAYMNQLVRSIETTLERARSPGNLESQRLNINNLPTSATGLRAGDLWNDTGVVRVSGGGAGIPVTDGDKGDITVSGSGTVWTVDSASSTIYADLAADGTTDDSTEINSIISTLAAAGGGVLQLPAGTIAIASTIAVTTPNIMIVGYGADLRHVAGAQFTGTTTRLKWTGANLGTMVSFISPSGAGNNKITGGGLKSISLDANSLAGKGLDIQSWNNGRFENLQFHEFLTAAINMDVVAALSDNRTTQENVFERIYIWQSAQDGIGIRLMSSNVGANPSLNTFSRMRIQHKNGNGIELNNCDNNTFFDTSVGLTAAGTGQGVICNGNDTAATYVARDNVFYGLSYAGQAPISKGTASFTYPAYNNSFHLLDDDNGTLLPVVEAGSYVGDVTFKSGERRSFTIASAVTTDLGASPTDRLAISGTATITSFGTVVNRRRFCRSTGAHTLTHNATSLILPGAADIVCANGDTWIAESDSSGNWRVIEFMRTQVPPYTGTYTPTLTNVTNLAASTAYVCQWLRVGSVVTVSGKVDVDPTAAAATELGISLPVASNFANANNLGGTAVAPAVAGQCAAILADATNDRASMQWVAVDTANRSMHFDFTYRII